MTDSLYSRGNKCRFRQIFVTVSWKHSKSLQIFLSNPKLARALTSTPKAIASANTSCCLATSELTPRAQSRLRGGVVLVPPTVYSILMSSLWDNRRMGHNLYIYNPIFSSFWPRHVTSLDKSRAINNILWILKMQTTAIEINAVG